MVIEQRLDGVVPALRNTSKFEQQVSIESSSNSTDFPALPVDQFWNCRIVVVRDPMGRQWPFPMGLVSSWDVRLIT